ncbi:hypothetical protein C0J52_16158 [Blattella germanica]|nr:hypothetical protein C0J52_16158 [Blattella germanica]
MIHQNQKVVMLNQSGEEPVECPLCLEPLEVDDLTFFPCTCGYQICRFCWHRIRTDENGLCPACRKAYPENPADFRPLSREEVARLKAQKKQKDQKRKQKVMENRKHLANVRVVQRNLVFVVGLPMRLADAEVLKKHEYFGKFGKIQKVVINQSTSYAGSQGPSASAYVTYQKADDALRAIQAVNNIVVDGRTIRSSLGTTKYCSHFLKNQMCPKPDCMYLHELGDAEASFTKEEMQQGKHQEYEKKLHEQLLNVSKEKICLIKLYSRALLTLSLNVALALHEQRSDNASNSSNKGEGNNRKHKGHQSNSHNTAEEENKSLKEDCRNSMVQNEKEKQNHSSQNIRQRKEQPSEKSEKPSSNEQHNKVSKDTDIVVEESGDNVKNARVKSVTNEEKQLDSGRGPLSAEKSPTVDSNSSFFSSSDTLLRGAGNAQGVVTTEDWEPGFHYNGLTNTTVMKDWAYNLPPVSFENNMITGSSLLHSNKSDSVFNLKENGRLLKNHSYIEDSLLTTPTTSKLAIASSADLLMGARSEENASVTMNQESVIRPVSSNLGHPPHSFVHYDPAILMINQFSGSGNGSPLLFMNGQPSRVTKRFLEDVQFAQQQKERQLSSHSDRGSGESLDMKSNFNVPHCSPHMTENGVENSMNSNENFDDTKGKHPPGFLYHQHKNKDTDVKYINSIINPIMSAVQISDKRTADDELGFDPFHETQKALAEMMEKESLMQRDLHNQHNALNHMPDHLAFNHQNALGEHHQVDLFNRQQHILPQQNHRIPPSNMSSCERLLDGLGLNRGVPVGNSVPRRTRLPPPGFANTPSSHIPLFGIPQSHSDAGKGDVHNAFSTLQPLNGNQPISRLFNPSLFITQ